MNLNASNALLKSLEEPPRNTIFFIVHNDSYKILDTIKSRCTEFKFFFSINEKKNIFNKIVENYQLNFNNVNLDKGDEVLSTDLEYGSCDRMWFYKAKRHGFIYNRSKVSLPIIDKESFCDDF